MFATSGGTVRRNDLSDFVNIHRSGKIAMKLDDPNSAEAGGAADRLIGVATCDDKNDVLLSTRQGKCIRFEVGDVRVFAGRSSMGVRGIKLATDGAEGGDEVISMSILRHVDFDTESRDVYLKMARKLRGGDEADAGDDEAGNGKVLTDEEFKRFAAAEEFILTATRNGFGKRTSAYEYRITGRGGQGIVSIATSKRNGDVVASFPVGDQDQVMMITDAGRLIRMPINDVRIAGRSTQGVTLFATGEDEHVTSVAHLPSEDAGDDASGDQAKEDQVGEDQGEEPDAAPGAAE
jgi:DNA gyrase subunit A